jgi:hypothetical protein
MSLKKIYSLSEAEGDDSTSYDWDNSDQSDGVPQEVPSNKPLSKLFVGNANQAGFGPASDGVPRDFGRSDGPLMAHGTDPNRTVPTPGTAVNIDRDRTIPNPRVNVGGTGKPPRAAGSFSKAPNAPAQGQDEPLPDLPLEGVSVMALYGYRTEAKAPIRGTGRLSELYSIEEMPRPKGSYDRPTMAALKWAKEHAGSEFNARDVFRVWRQAGGQPNQTDETKAYQSFQTTLRRFIDPRGRGTPEQPLVTVMKGMQGAHGARAIYSWGAVRPSKTAAAKPMPGATAYDDMDLGPAGSMDQEPEGEPGAEPEQGPQGEPEGEPEAQAEPEQEPEDQATEDQLDWIPEADPETGVGRSMIALHEDDPEKLQELLAAVSTAATVMAAAQESIKIYGRGSAMGSHGIKVAKSAAANLGLPDPDGVLA